MSYLTDPLLERASVPETAIAYDESLRVKLRSAPPAFKAAVDRNRAARGLPRLWPTRAAQPPARRRHEPSRPSSYVLAGVVAPYVSDPVAIPGQGDRMREWFAPECWSAMIDRVAGGRHVRLLDRHDGSPLATTSNGSLRFDVDDALGLTLTAYLSDVRATRQVVEKFGKHGVPLSIGFVSLKTETRRLLGREVRAIVEAACDHVALLGDGRTPAYPGANAVFAASDSTADVRAALDAAKRQAYLRLVRLHG